MNPDRLAQLVLDRRFGDLTDDDRRELDAALSTDASLRDEADRLERLLDEAPRAGVVARPDFTDRLQARLADEAVYDEERGRRFRRSLRRIMVAYAGVAACAMFYVAFHGGPERDASSIERRNVADLDLGWIPAKVVPFSRPAGK